MPFNIRDLEGNFILFDKIPVSTIKDLQLRFQAFLDHRVGTKRRYYDSVQLDTTILLWGFVMEHDTR